MNKLIVELDYVLGLHGLKIGYDLHLSEDEIISSFILKCKELKDELENKDLQIQKLKFNNDDFSKENSRMFENLHPNNTLDDYEIMYKDNLEDL